MIEFSAAGLQGVRMSNPDPSLAERAASFRKDVIEPVLQTLSELSGRELGGEAAIQLLKGKL